jgi:hypothetical protein
VYLSSHILETESLVFEAKARRTHSPWHLAIMSPSEPQDIELGNPSEQARATTRQAPGLVLPQGDPEIPIPSCDTIQATAPARSNSGSWWQRHVKRNRDTLPDEFEVRLKKSEPSEHTGNLLQDYAKIKDHLIDDRFILEFLSLDIFSNAGRGNDYGR